MDLVVEKFIVCDDIRRENTGKLLIVGMYPDDKLVVHQEFHYRHQMVSFFISIRGDFPEGEMIFEIFGPDNDSILKAPPKQYVDKSYQRAQLTFGIGNLTFSKPGEYKVVVTFPNHERKAIPFFIEKGDNSEQISQRKQKK
jgi:hypothetical protein